MTTARPFPLTLAAAAIVTTSLALTAAAMNLQWSAAPQAGQALHSAWLYVNIMLTLTLLVTWPTFTFSTLRKPPARESIRREFLWDFAALAVASIPALAVAAFLSGITSQQLMATVCLQAAFGIFSLGILTFAYSRNSLCAPAAGLLSALALAAPVLVYFYVEFLPLAPKFWLTLVPEIAIAHATEPANVLSSLTPLIYAIIGILLFSIPQFTARSHVNIPKT